jgi:hypothetical protein
MNAALKATIIVFMGLAAFHFFPQETMTAAFMPLFIYQMAMGH